MQALILAAGMGKRLGELTKSNTKCMLEVDGVKLIDRVLSQIKSVGIKHLVIVVGFEKENLIEHLAIVQHGLVIDYVVNPVYDQTNNIYSLYLAREYLAKDDTILLESDLIIEQSILERLINDPRDNLAVVDKYQSWMDGTVVVLSEQDDIISFIPKKFFQYENIVNYYKTVNIYKFSREFAEHIYTPFLEAYSHALGMNEYYEQVLRVIATLEKNDLKALRLTGEKWYEIDDVQDKDNAETIFSTTADAGLRKMQERYGGYWRFPLVKDFCYLVNPYFPTIKMEGAFRAYFHDIISQYPSGSKVQCLLAGRLFNVRSNSIAVGNGASEIIKAISSILDGKFGLRYPTFNEYEQSIGTDRIVKQYSGPNLKYGIDDLLGLSLKCDNLILINPDNPSGGYLKKNEIIKLVSKLNQSNKFIVVDESFVDFTDDGESNTLIQQDILDAYPNLIVIKSISKSYGVPGLRIGVVASGNATIISKVIAGLPIWNINSFAEFFLQIIMEHKGDYALSCQYLARDRKRFFEQLSELHGLYVHPSQANYFTIKLNGGVTAQWLAATLLNKFGIFIKVLTGKEGFDCGEYIRVAVRDENDNNYFVDSIKAVIS